jgi:hypothetical protein
MVILGFFLRLIQDLTVCLTMIIAAFPHTRSIAAFTLASMLWMSAVTALGVISLIIYL